MGLSEDEKAGRKHLLLTAGVPERYFNRPLSTLGNAGASLREYIKEDYAADAQEFRGAVIQHSTPSIAQSFARDITILGASTHFYYLQTFATRFNTEEGQPQSYVIEWFEQPDAESPFSSRERYNLETRITELMDDNVLFYLFTGVPVENSKWWSRSFTDMLTERNRLLRVTNDGNRAGGKRTSIVDSESKGQKGPRPSRRVAVR